MKVYITKQIKPNKNKKLKHYNFIKLPVRGMPRPNAFIWLGVDVKPGGGSRDRGADGLIRIPSINFEQLLILKKRKENPVKN